jgi:hypothetical protein
MHRTFRLLPLLPLLAFISPSLPGCAGDQPPPSLGQTGEPIGNQILRAVPSLKDERFSTLLDFESPDDTVFCSTTDSGGAVTPATTSTIKPHTGRASLQIPASASGLTIKLSSLLAGRAFPASWALIGGYFYSSQPAKITVSLNPPLPGTQPRPVDLPASTWTPVFAELPQGSPVQSIPALQFDLPSPHAPIYCDDVMLIDNYKILAAPPDNALPDTAHDSSAENVIPTADVVAGQMPPWTVSRRGLNFTGVAPARFNFNLVTREFSPTGWSIDEANPMRARFHSDPSSAMAARTLTIYADGRAFWNDEYKPMSTAAQNPTLIAQHRAPAQIEVSEGLGRVDRNTPGDAYNTGYNPTTGSYRILATGPRIELRFSPTTTPVLSPILEFSNLPFGTPIITLEGRLIEQSTRTSTGTLLVELPAKIDRPVTVNVRIQN